MQALEAAPDDDLLGADLPALLRRCSGEAIDALFRVENLEDRFAVCLFFLKDETLGYRQKEVMVDLLGVVKQMMQPDRHADVDPHPRRLTAFFRDRDNEFLLMRFACYEAIGVAIGEAGNVKAADHLIEDILYWKFQYPDIRGATDEWETVVNPYHLPKIRCWMHIIESNPALFERLAAALNVQLKLGGVFIADTDLFQRDVTRFLNADIRPIYFVAKQLLRTLPVYFNEVGAEGELRAVSTQIDEICGRRDTLMHFLRKQVHAESSNRLVAFSRAVLEYWLTLDRRGSSPTSRPTRWRRSATSGSGRRGRTTSLVALQPACRRGRAPTRPLDGLLALAPDELDEAALAASAGDGDGRERPARPAGPAGAPPRRAHGAHAPAARAQVLAVGRRGGRGRRPPPRRSTAARGTASSRALARWQARPRRRTRDALLDAALTVLEQLKAIVLGHGGVDGDREHLPEAPHRRRHPLHLRQLQRAQVRRPRALVPRREPRRPPARRLVAEGIELYVTRDSLRRMATALRRFERALAADGVDSRALDANLDMLESSFAMPQLHLPPVPERLPVPREQRHRALVDVRCSATSRCCTRCWSTTRGSARRVACPSTPWPSWCCARCWSPASACRRSTATWPPSLRQISMLNGRLGQPRRSRG